jgi:subtilisin family serine protease
VAQYEHLQLVRLPEQLERRKHGGGRAPERDISAHSGKLRGELDTAVAEQQARRKPEFVDPSLVLRVRMTGGSMEADWEQLGLTLLASDPDRSLVLFSSGDDMAAFRERLAAFAGGPPPDQKGTPYAAFIGGIEEIGSLEASDRIGIRLREEGFNGSSDFAEEAGYLLDIELWDLGRRELRTRKLEQLEAYIAAREGEPIDHYVGPSITMVRARCPGKLVRTLLTIEDIQSIDLPPEPDIVTGEALDLVLTDLPELAAVDPNAPVIGVIDSGVNAHPLLEDVLVGAIGVPETLGSADDWGHGTRVAGVSLFGDLRGQLDAGALTRHARIASAKVVNDQGAFDERRLVPAQMREAITRLNAEFGCRIFVISLGDAKRTYDGGKVGPWAATLDELARELDVLIIASAGNRAPRGGTRLEQAVTEYPAYLLEPANRFCEPAGAMNVLTVGALAHGEGLSPEFAEDVKVRPITQAMEPSPFTRVGPGINGAVKPDLVDVGGTMVYDPVVARLRKGEDLPTAGVMTLHHKFIDRLFTAGSGTSYAAPLVAHKAGQLLATFPGASANLLRALLVGAARIPEEADAKLAAHGALAARTVCGHGRVDPLRAAFSDDHRVILFAEDELPLDHFAVYHVPIPDLFQNGGKRTIRVSLAYDPPVRHSRADYTGIGMSYRLLRGCSSALIFDHFRRRKKEEGRHPDIEGRYNCSLQPGAQQREKGTVQTASVTFSQATEGYGEDYYLVVRCEGGWAESFMTSQRFAVVVELEHQQEVRLYARLRARIRV